MGNWRGRSKMAAAGRPPGRRSAVAALVLAALVLAAGCGEELSEAEVQALVGQGGSQEFNIGNDVEFGTASNHAANFLLGSRITVPGTVALKRFGLITKATGPQVQMALYADVSGNPGPLVAFTPITAMTLGVQEIPVAEVALPAGDYWVMAVYDVDASVGVLNDGVTPYKFVALFFGSPLPDPFPPPNTQTGAQFNYYIVVQSS